MAILNTSGVTLRIVKNESIKRLFSIESSLTLPIPFKFNGSIYLSILAFTGKKNTTNGKIEIFRPNAKVVLDYPRGKIVHFIDFVGFKKGNEQIWKSPIGVFPHTGIENMKLSEYKFSRNELLLKYDTIIESLKNGECENYLRIEFRNIFFQLCEPSLIIFLRKLGLEFFSFIEGTR